MKTKTLLKTMAVLFAVIIGTSWPTTVKAQNFNDGTLTYTINPDGTTVTCTGLVSWIPSVTDLVIPSSVIYLDDVYTVTIIGEGAFASWGMFGMTLYGSLTIPNTVTTICDNAFRRSGGGTLTIGNSVTTIGTSAFESSVYTGSIIIPDNVVTIGDYAFYNCDHFDGSIVIGNSVTTIGEHAFYDCDGLTGTLTLGESVETIGKSAFSGCNLLSGSLVIPNSVIEIDTSAFSVLFSMHGTLTLSNQLTTIRYGSFGSSGYSGSLTIPNSVTVIEDGAFWGDNFFNGTLTLPESLTTIGNDAFEGCHFTGHLTIPNSVVEIGIDAFHWCHYNSITFSENLVTIGERAFGGNTYYEGTLRIPNSVVTLGDRAFQDFTCDTVIIGSSVTEVGYGCFDGITHPDIMICLATTPPAMEYLAYYTIDELVVTCGSLEAYQNSNWSQYFNTISEDCVMAYDFDDGTLQGWTNIDADGDSYAWESSAAPASYLPNSNNLSGQGHNSSQNFVLSGSYSNVYGSLYPDNYLVSPEKKPYKSISFWACTHDTDYPAEHFGVAVSTTGNTNAADFITIEEWTMTAKIPGNWYEYTADLSDYEGQDIWVAIRHFNCYDQFLLDVDDITLDTKWDPTTPVTVGNWEEATNSTNIPIGGMHKYACSQQIYTVQDIGQSGFIESFTIWMANVGNEIVPKQNIEIYFKEVDRDDFSDGTFEIMTADDLVYSGEVWVNNREFEPRRFTLNTPFEYSGTRNLLICCNKSSDDITLTLYQKVFSRPTHNRTIAVSNETNPYDLTAPITSTLILTVRNIITFNMMSTLSQDVAEVADLDIVLYPNPTNGIVNIKVENLQNISIYNLLGEKVFETPASGDSFEYDFSRFGNGVYLVKIETEKGVLTKRVMVE